jgi:hypothetical protein
METKLPESFESNLARGQVGESRIAHWMMGRGQNVMPVYELELDTGKGPRFLTPEGPLVAPDMFIMPAMIWAEAKHKTVFSWHRITGCWVTGIDISHYEEYQKVEERSRNPVWLLFLHAHSQPSDDDIKMGCPPTCPTGLFGERLTFLVTRENHRHTNWGRHGMVYWAAPPLRRLAAIEELTRLGQAV